MRLAVVVMATLTFVGAGLRGITTSVPAATWYVAKSDFTSHYF